MAKSAKAGRTKAKAARKARGGTEAAAPARDGEAAADPRDKASAEEAERSLGRWIARILPAGTLLLAIGVGLGASLGPALLVLAAGTLLGTIALLWASVRTLGGDAPLPIDLESIAARRHAVDDLDERKSRILRALKDLEHEHAVGKIEDGDYEEIAAKYRAEAKDVMRAMDADLEPLRERAEEIARNHLKKQGIDGAAVTAPSDDDEDGEDDEEDEDDDGGDGASDAPEAADVAMPAPERRACVKCTTSNEPDATFCKNCGAPLESRSADAPKDGDVSA